MCMFVFVCMFVCVFVFVCVCLCLFVCVCVCQREGGREIHKASSSHVQGISFPSGVCTVLIKMRVLNDYQYY